MSAAVWFCLGAVVGVLVRNGGEWVGFLLDRRNAS